MAVHHFFKSSKVKSTFIYCCYLSERLTPDPSKTEHLSTFAQVEKGMVVGLHVANWAGLNPNPHDPSQPKVKLGLRLFLFRLGSRHYFETRTKFGSINKF